MRLTLMTILTLALCPVAPAARAQDAPDLSGTLPILDEDFSDGLSRYDGRRGVWSTLPRGGRLMTNAAETVFLDRGVLPAPADAALPDLIALTDDGLSLRTATLPDDALAAVRSYMADTGQGDRADKVRFATGQINTAKTWSQTYGWFEVEARIPRGKGRWPAFWLTFAGRGWPPEIDIFEAYGAGIAQPTPKDGTFNTAVLFDALDAEREPTHSVDIENPYDANAPLPRAKTRGKGEVYTFGRLHDGSGNIDAPIYDAFHTWATMWTPTEVIFYFGPDHDSLREIYRTPTPEDVTDPMYLIANDQFTARGGWWPADTALDAVLDPANDFLIRRIVIRALTPDVTLEAAQADDPRGTVVTDTPGNDVLATGAGFDVIRLSGGADTLRLAPGRENKVVAGFGADDRLDLTGWPFADAEDVLSRLTQVGPDVWLPAGTEMFWPQTVVFRDAGVADFTAAQFVLP